MEDPTTEPPIPTRRVSALKGSLAERMMKSMGWEEGKGLGKNAEGITKHITVERRLEGQGLGLELDTGGNSAFSSTTTGFSNALASLSKKYGAPAPDDGDGDAPRRKSARAKKFVAPRGHHKKKDLATVAATDMAAILGGRPDPFARAAAARAARPAAAAAANDENSPVADAAAAKQAKKEKKKRKREEAAAAEAEAEAAEAKKKRKEAKKAKRKAKGS